MSLKPEAKSPDTRDWLRRHAAGLASATLGLLAIGAAALIVLSRDGSLLDVPDPRITVSLWLPALAAAIAAFARREDIYALPIAGIVLATCALFLGWAVVLAVIAAIAITVILILSQFIG